MRRIENLEPRLALSAEATFVAQVGDIDTVGFDDATYYAETIEGNTSVFRIVDGTPEFVDEIAARNAQLSATQTSIVLVANYANQGTLWTSKGSEAFEQVSLDVTYGSSPRAFQSYGGHTYFATDQGVYRTDGTALGTQKLSNQINVHKLAVSRNHVLTFEPETSLSFPQRGSVPGVIRSLDLRTGALTTHAEVTGTPHFDSDEESIPHTQ